MTATLTDTRVTRAALASSKRGFLPTQIPNCRLWLAADRIYGLASGDPVATWSDLSPAKNDATQATAAKKPTWQTGVLNGKPVVRFDGVDDFLSLGTALAFERTDSWACFLVVKDTSGAADHTFLGNILSSGTFRGWEIIFVDGTARLASFTLNTWGGSWGASNAIAVEFTGNVKTSFAILTHTYNGASLASGLAQFKDGASLAVASTLRDALTATIIDAAAVSAIGGRSGLSNFPAMDLAELLVYNRALSTAELGLVHRYCGQKYGLAVAA